MYLNAKPVNATFIILAYNKAHKNSIVPAKFAPNVLTIAFVKFKENMKKNLQLLEEKVSFLKKLLNFKIELMLFLKINILQNKETKLILQNLSFKILTLSKEISKIINTKTSYL